MSIQFKHKIKKQAIFYNDLISGRSISGVNGSAGEFGVNGPSIYFSDYTPEDDYVKSILLDKIESGLFLSSNTSQKLIGISYTPGDLIITEKKYIYKLIDIDGKFDLKFLGKIKPKKHESDIKKTLLDNLIKIEINDLKKEVYDLPVPSNKCMDVDSSAQASYANWYLKVENGTLRTTVTRDSSTRTHYDFFEKDYKHSFKKAFGISFNPIIRISDSSVLNDFDFYLKIKIPIKKSPQGESSLLEYIVNQSLNTDSRKNEYIDPVPDNLQNLFEFYKFSEIKLNPKKIGDSSTDGSIYITDMTCDKLHPAGNNISSNIGFPDLINTSATSSWGDLPDVKTAGCINSWAHVEYYIVAVPSRMVPIPEFYSGLSSKRELKLRDEFLKSIQKDDNYRFCYGDNTNVYFLTYQSRKDEYSINLFYDGYANWRGGDSAYFSGLCHNYDSSCFDKWKKGNNPGTDDIIQKTNVNAECEYSNYVNHINLLNRNIDGGREPADSSLEYDITYRLDYEKNYIANDFIIPFYLNKNNIYELTCVNKKTGETYITTSQPIDIQYGEQQI